MSADIELMVHQEWEREYKEQVKKGLRMKELEREATKEFYKEKHGKVLGARDNVVEVRFRKGVIY